MGFFQQFTLLLWKNWLLQRSIITLIEIILPIGCALLMFTLRATTEKTNENYKDGKMETISVDDTPLQNRRFEIPYTPNSTIIETLITDIQKTMAKEMKTTSIPVEFVGFSTQDAMVKYSTNHINNIPCAIEFPQVKMSDEKLPKKLVVHLRPGHIEDRQISANDWKTKENIPSNLSHIPPDKILYMYKMSGFYYMQRLIQEAVSKHWNSSADATLQNMNYNIYKMPFPPYFQDAMLRLLKIMLSLLLTLSFLPMATQLTRRIVYEKEKKLKESMKLMGLNPAAHWTSWFLTSLIYTLFIMGIFATICGINSGKYGAVLDTSSMSVVFVFLLCYGIAIIAFSFMMSAFFRNAFMGAVACGIIFFLSYCPYYYLDGFYRQISRSSKLASSLLFPTAMALGIRTLIEAEQEGLGIQWSNINKPVTVEDDYFLLDAMLMLLGDSAIYFVITWYVDHICPGEFAVSKPFYFPFTRSYWCRRAPVAKNVDSVDSSSSKFFEKEPSGLKVGIAVKNLRKEFGYGDRKVVAIDGMNLNMFEDQISVLLGHNGAGKTTTVSVLTGFLTASGGTVVVNGYDNNSDIQSVRQNLGLCLKHDILYDTLTVNEHLQFFGSLKGCPKNDLHDEVSKIAKEIGLDSKMYKQTQYLSGGQKRKLSVGIALIAGSKVVILDEPTSGMDPSTRWQTWDILKRNRQGRTILLTTHIMDEADILGDRIAIMSEGVVKCCGTPFFLKKIYGAGYHLVIVKEPTCDVQSITSLVQQFISSAKLETEVNTELSYLLPESQDHKFPDLFTVIEQQMGQLGISSFGTTLTTMEEVFFRSLPTMFLPLFLDALFSKKSKEENNADDNAAKGDNTADNTADSTADNTADNAVDNTANVAGDGAADNAADKTDGKTAEKPAEKAAVNTNDNAADKADDNTADKADENSDDSSDPFKENEDTMLAFNDGYRKVTGCRLDLLRFKGLLIKKILYTWRSIPIIIVQIIFVVIFMVLAHIAPSKAPLEDEVKLVLNLEPFEGSRVPYRESITSMPITAKLAKLYSEQLGSGNVGELIDLSILRNDADAVSPSDPKLHNITNYYLQRAKSLGLATYNQKMVIGARFGASGNGSIDVYSHYNRVPHHASAISVSYTMNAVLGYFTTPEHSITYVNHPLPIKRENAVLPKPGIVVAVCIMVGISFPSTIFIIGLLEEREVGNKHLQMATGVTPILYWAATLLWDIFTHVLTVFLLLKVFMGFKYPEYTEDQNIYIVVLIMMAYGLAIHPYMYVFQFLFKSTAAGIIHTVVLNLFSGVVPVFIYFVLAMLRKSNAAVDWIGMILFPQYSMARAFMDHKSNWDIKATCEKMKYTTACTTFPQGPCCRGTCDSKEYTCLNFVDNTLDLKYPGIGRYVIAMFVHCVVSCLLTLAIDYNVFPRIWNKIRPFKMSDNEVEATLRVDPDVAQERKRIELEGDNKEPKDALVLRNLCKRYGNFIAVDRLSVGIPEKECFGLLGENGAGMTTTLKMMTGDVMATYGNLHLWSYDIKNNQKKVQENMGYCPQLDALMDHLTGRETLHMFARLKGVPELHVAFVCRRLLDILKLSKCADKFTADFSGGNKRKLCIAIALVGDPAFILLDEPTTGLDQEGKEQLWKILSKVQENGRTIVLTSHSMEECDALCTRIAIMVNGQFKCLGTPEHLKNKFGQGYTLIIRLGTVHDHEGDPKDTCLAPSQPMIDVVLNRFPASRVFDDRQGYVHFQVPDADLRLSEVFKLMEESKSKKLLDDYSVHQTTLEQVFLFFTRSQDLPREDNKRTCCW